MKVWSSIVRMIEAEGRCALVSVVDTQGSAPRDAGAHMVVSAAGYTGSIGGGTLEWHAIAAAQAMLAKGPEVKQSRHALGPDLGQCCGGQVRLQTEIFSTDDLAYAVSCASREEEGSFTIERHGAILRFGEFRRTVLIVGAGHVGRALTLALAPLPFTVIWTDPRADAFPQAIPRNAVVSHDPISMIDRLPEASLAFIMSHSHALDLAVVEHALRNVRIAHVGLIGSATKRARFEARVKKAGLPVSRIEELICPIGVGGIRSKEPAVIAAATAAQILVLDEALRLATGMERSQHAVRGAGGAL